MNVKIYTIAEMKAWLCEGCNNGLSFNLISNARATALIHNPYAKDSTPAIAVAYDDNDQPVGYTAVFEDRWNGQPIYWGTTGFIDASMRGKGVGTRLYSTMMEACNNKWYASDSTPAALTISKKTGLGIYYFNRYYLSFEHSTNLKARIKAWMVGNANKKSLEKLDSSTTRLEVISTIDDITYAFIQQHAGRDIFHRSQIMLNWMLQYPFIACAPEELASYSEYLFTPSAAQYTLYAFRIMKEKKVIGFTMCRLDMGDLVLLYLYKDEEYANDVYASLVRHVLMQPFKRFRTFDKGLIDFYDRIGAKSMNTKSRIQQVSLSVPADVKIDPSQILQGGDGDMFC